MSNTERRSPAHIRVVIGSNDAQLRSLLGRSLSDDGRFRVVADGADGEAVVAAPLRFDVAVLDLSLRGLGILGVISDLRRRHPSPPVVVVSEHDAVYLRHAVEAEGAADYLLIPENLDETAERIVRAYEASRSGRYGPRALLASS